MTDRELLLLAAKAAGYDISHKMNTERHELSVPIDDLWAEHNGTLVSTGWNPLKDDGHALRLAVKLDMNIDIQGAWIRVDCGDDFVSENAKNDPFAATRRAIVRAAAAIGGKL